VLPQKRIKVDIAFITPGMFVAQLDRSWLETPFVTRGFEIKGEQEIHLLRKFCKHVYVDSSRSTVPEGQILEAHVSVVKDPFAPQVPGEAENRPLSIARKLLRLIQRFGISGREAEISLAKEFPEARAARSRCVEGMKEILADVKSGKGVNIDKLKDAMVPMVDSLSRNSDAMAWLCHLPGSDDPGPGINISSAVWSVIMGQHLGMNRHALGNLAMGGVLLDIGNAQIPESMIVASGTPTDDEDEITKLHVDYGLKIARTAPGIHDDVIAMIRCHHEFHDGSGYPHALEGKDIPIFGRIAGAVNYYDAMVSGKSRDSAISPYDAICQLNSAAGTKFQREVVNSFVQAMGMFPTGSLVELNTGEVALVMEQHKVRRLRPRLMLILDKDKQPLDSGKTLELSKVPDTGTSRKARWIVKGHVAGAFDIDPRNYLFGSRKSD
jgi:HD-GYP domain-containing protein (c-di-GMP phosphodiesterase class II)